jgi:hypothetical protein
MLDLSSLVDLLEQLLLMLGITCSMARYVFFSLFVLSLRDDRFL